MWVLLFVLSHQAIPPVEVKFSPTVIAQEFTSAARCEAAKSFILAAFGNDPDMMNHELARRFETGDLSSRQKVVVQARCLRK
jgi:hypothetical protein